MVKFMLNFTYCFIVQFWVSVNAGGGFIQRNDGHLNLKNTLIA